MGEVPSIPFQSGEGIRFHGAKVAVFVGSKLVTLLRDEKPDIPWPGAWDLPGGGREGAESGWDCAERECFEEVSLKLSPEAVIWAKCYESKGLNFWFFVARVDASRQEELVLGSEGQSIRLMTVDEFLRETDAVPHFQKRLADWISGLGAELEPS